MKCEFCASSNTTTGTLEGISFRPSQQRPRFFETGVYGITATVCLECGRLSQFSLDTEVLKKIMGGSRMIRNE